MCSSEFNLQGTNMPLQQINRALKQLEFLQSLPNQKGVVETNLFPDILNDSFKQ